MATEYKPVQITDRAVTSADHIAGSYTLPIGVVTRYDPTDGLLYLAFPSSPTANDTVEIKNATKSESPVTLVPYNPNPPSHQVEAPGADDTDYTLLTPFTVRAPAASYRWIFDGTDTWVLDKDYEITEAKAKTTQIFGNYTLQRNNEIVLADSTTGPLTVTIPTDWPDDSKFTVSKISYDRNLITVTTQGSERIENIRILSSTLGSSAGLIAESESFSYAKRGLNWYNYSHSLSDYPEVWFYDGPLDLTPGTSLIPIIVDPDTTENSILFTNAGGLLTAQFDMTFSVEVQVVFTHNLSGNNQDVWGRVTVQTSSTDVANILVPIDAAFAHSRAGIYGDTRAANSLVRMQVGQTIGIYGEEVDSTGGSTTDIEGLLVVFTIRS